MLRVHGDVLAAGELVHVDVVRAPVEAQVHAAMEEGLALEALAHARLREEVHGALLQHARADRALDLLARARLDHHRADAGKIEEMREQESRGTRADDADLRAWSSSHSQQRGEGAARGELARIPGQRHAALLQHDQAIGALGHPAVVAIDDEGRDARRADLADHAPHFLHDERRQALGRLVEDDELRDASSARARWRASAARRRRAARRGCRAARAGAETLRARARCVQSRAPVARAAAPPSPGSRAP